MAARRKQPEQHSADAAIQQPSALSIPTSGVIVREPESIAVVDSPLDKDYADALSFGEDVLTIMVQPSGEENAQTVIDVYINGEAKWVKVGQPTKIKRKFVEALLRAKPISISTQTGNASAWMSGDAPSIANEIRRNMRAKYPLSIMSDPSPKGGEWINRLMYEQ